MVAGNAVPAVAVEAPRQTLVARSWLEYCVEAPAESVKPKFLFTGTTQEKSAPGQTLRRGSRYIAAPFLRLR